MKKTILFLFTVIAFQPGFAQQTKSNQSIWEEYYDKIMSYFTTSSTPVKNTTQTTVQKSAAQLQAEKQAAQQRAADQQRQAAEQARLKEEANAAQRAEAEKALLSEKVQKVKTLAMTLLNHGLYSSTYITVEGDRELQNLVQQNSKVSVDAKLIQITARIASDLSRGRVLPSRMVGKVWIDDKPFAHQATAEAFVNGTISQVDFVAKVAPKNAVYLNAQTLMQRLADLKLNKEWAEKPQNLTLGTVSRKTTDSTLITFLRKRLDNLGYKNNVNNGVYDSELEYTIKAFQSDNGLTSDGAVGSGTWGLLDKSIDSLLTLASLNLDRTRWLPDSALSEYVYVNLARQQLQYFKDNVEELAFKTINGRLDRQTPMMVDRISYVVINPTWTVPPGIFKKDKLPKLQENPNYVNEHNMEIRDGRGLVVDPFSVDWNDPNISSLRYTIVQKPGPDNALGFIKFPLSNPYSIYMHDTNERYLFRDGNRLKSSGCVRLEKPFELAEKIMSGTKWNADSLRQNSEYSPVVASKPSDLSLTRKIPVFLAYKTMSLESGGQIKISKDHYEIDKIMYNVMMGKPVDASSMMATQGQGI